MRAAHELVQRALGRRACARRVDRRGWHRRERGTAVDVTAFVRVLSAVVLSAVVFAGCDRGSAQPAGGHKAAAASAPGLRFARPPVAVLTTSGVIATAVRTTTALPGDGLGLGAALRTSRADPNAGSELERIPGYRRCYANEAPIAGGQPLGVGEQVTVELTTESGVVLTASVPLTAAPSTKSEVVRRSLARTLGCTRGVSEQRCSGSVTGAILTIHVQRALGGATCATARAVFRRVAIWADSRRCFKDLCVRRHRINRGFRCSVARVGEADWTIACRRGKQSVRGSAAE